MNIAVLIVCYFFLGSSEKKDPKIYQMVGCPVNRLPKNAGVQQVLDIPVSGDSTEVPRILSNEEKPKISFSICSLPIVWIG